MDGIFRFVDLCPNLAPRVSYFNNPKKRWQLYDLERGELPDAYMVLSTENDVMEDRAESSPKRARRNTRASARSARNTKNPRWLRAKQQAEIRSQMHKQLREAEDSVQWGSIAVSGVYDQYVLDDAVEEVCIYFPSCLCVFDECVCSSLFTKLPFV